MKALAVFHEHGFGLGVRIFCSHRPRFRHVFVALNDGVGWLRIDAQAHFTKLERLDVAHDYDLGAFYRSEGYLVVETYATEPTRRNLAPIWFSCVETSKRLLGVQDWWVWTPWQLYRQLRRRAHAR